MVRQKAVRPASQFLQKPQPMLNGRQTMSPVLIRSTALPDLGHFTHVLVAKHATRLHIGSTLIHVQVGAAYVGSCDSHQHVGRLFDFCVSNIFHFDIAWSFVDDCFHG